MIWSMSLLAFAQENPATPGDPPAPVEAGAPAAWAVVAGEPASDEGAAMIAMIGLLQQGIPQHVEYPLVAPMAEVGGGEGFVVVVATPRGRAAADRLSRNLVERGIAARVVPTAVAAEDVRVIAVDQVKVTGNGASLFPYGVCLGPEAEGECWASGTLDARGRLVLPFAVVPEGTRAALHIQAGEPWKCPITSIGVVRLDMDVWLKSPVEVACYEDSRPTRRAKVRSE